MGHGEDYSVGGTKMDRIIASLYLLRESSDKALQAIYVALRSGTEDQHGADALNAVLRCCEQFIADSPVEAK